MKYRHPTLYNIVENAKAVLIAFFWVVIVLSIFVPNATDMWLPNGFTK